MANFYENHAITQAVLSDPQLRLFLGLSEQELADFAITIPPKEQQQFFELMARLTITLVQMQEALQNPASQEFLQNTSDDEMYSFAKEQGLLVFFEDLDGILDSNLKGRMQKIFRRTSLLGGKILYEHEGRSFFHPYFLSILMESNTNRDFKTNVYTKLEIFMHRFGIAMFEELKSAIKVLLNKNKQ